MKIVLLYVFIIKYSMFVGIHWLYPVRSSDDIYHIYWCGLPIVITHCANMLMGIFFSFNLHKLYRLMHLKEDDSCVLVKGVMSV